MVKTLVCCPFLMCLIKTHQYCLNFKSTSHEVIIRNCTVNSYDTVLVFSGSIRKLKDRTAQLFIRTRGWHLDEKHLVIDGKPISGAFMDFGLYMFHNTKPRMDKGSAPYFYLPKMEHRTEAALWNEVFKFSENYMKIPQGL